MFLSFALINIIISVVVLTVVVDVVVKSYAISCK